MPTAPTAGTPGTAGPVTPTPVETGAPPRPTIPIASTVFLPIAMRPPGSPSAGTPPATGTAPGSGTPPATPTQTPTSAPPVEGFLIASGIVSAPDIAGDPSRDQCPYLVVWHDGSVPEGAIRAAFLGIEGVGATLDVSGDAGAAGPPAVAYSPVMERWLVVWPAPDEQSVSALRGRFVGCPRPDGPVVDIGRYWLIEDQPAVAADGDGFAVVWRRSFSGRPDLQLVGVRVTGPDVAEPQELGDPGPVAEPAIGCAGTGACLVTWTTQAEEAMFRDVVGRGWSPRAGAVASDTLRVAVERIGEPPTVACDRASDTPACVVAWARASRYSEVLAVTVRSTDAGDGVAFALDGAPVSVSMTLGGSFQPDLAADDGGFVLAYAMGPPAHPAPDIAAVRLGLPTSGGAPTVGERTVLSEDEVPSRVPAVAAAEPPYAMFVWTDSLALPRRIVGAHRALADPAVGP